MKPYGNRFLCEMSKRFQYLIAHHQTRGSAMFIFFNLMFAHEFTFGSTIDKIKSEQRRRRNDENLPGECIQKVISNKIHISICHNTFASYRNMFWHSCGKLVYHSDNILLFQSDDKEKFIIDTQFQFALYFLLCTSHAKCGFSVRVYVSGVWVSTTLYN